MAWAGSLGVAGRWALISPGVAGRGALGSDSERRLQRFSSRTSGRGLPTLPVSAAGGRWPARSGSYGPKGVEPGQQQGRLIEGESGVTCTSAAAATQTRADRRRGGVSSRARRPARRTDAYGQRGGRRARWAGRDVESEPPPARPEVATSTNRRSVPGLGHRVLPKPQVTVTGRMGRRVALPGNPAGLASMIRDMAPTRLPGLGRGLNHQSPSSHRVS